jgi:hypothetical protein
MLQLNADVTISRCPKRHEIPDAASRLQNRGLSENAEAGDGLMDGGDDGG